MDTIIGAFYPFSRDHSNINVIPYRYTHMKQFQLEISVWALPISEIITIIVHNITLCALSIHLEHMRCTHWACTSAQSTARAVGSQTSCCMVFCTARASLHTVVQCLVFNTVYYHTTTHCSTRHIVQWTPPTLLQLLSPDHCSLSFRKMWTLTPSIDSL